MRIICIVTLLVFSHQAEALIRQWLTEVEEHKDVLQDQVQSNVQEQGVERITKEFCEGLAPAELRKLKVHRHFCREMTGNLTSHAASLLQTFLVDPHLTC
jgi:hypothetical protein